MSLSVYLISKEIDKKECLHCGSTYDHRNELFWANITHNLGGMAEEAGIYKHLWRPEEIGITTASELIEPLTNGLNAMKSDPKRFKKFSADNEWGTYEQFIPWIADYLCACIENPDAEINISR